MSWRVSRNQCETRQSFRQDQQPLAFTRRGALAAVAVRGSGALLPARYVAGAVLAGVRWSGAVPAAVAVVAAVRLALAVCHRLAQAFSLARRLSRNSKNP